jgi:hypothetical protein
MRPALALVCAALLVTSCGFAGTGITPTDWECQTNDMHAQLYRSYGPTRELAFQQAMQQCHEQSMEGSTCMGDPEKCLPPKPQ